MKVKFEWEHEVDLVEAPEGWHWVGSIGHRSQYVMLQQVVVTAETQGIGCITISDAGIIAGYTPSDGEHQCMGVQSDTRTASVALIRAMGLEVAP